MRGRPRGDEQQEKAKQLHPVHSHLGYATLILKKVPHVQWRKVQTIGTTKAQLLTSYSYVQLYRFKKAILGVYVQKIVYTQVCTEGSIHVVFCRRNP